MVSWKRIAGKTIRTLNQAEQRLAEGAHPGPHRGDVALTRFSRAVGMCVQKSNDIAPLFFAGQYCRSIEFDTRGTADGAPKPASIPEPSAPFPDQRPALLAIRRLPWLAASYRFRGG